MNLLLRFLTTAACTLAVALLCAQTAPTTPTYWKLGADLNTTFFQSAFLNWTEGGSNTVAVGFLANGIAKYQKENTSWDNTLILQYSMQRVGGKTMPFVKNIDRLELLSFFGHRASDKLQYSALGSFKSQLTPTENAAGAMLSKFFAPAEMLIGPGIKYGWGDKKTKDNLVINISPATSKTIFVADQTIADAGRFTGVPATYDTAGTKLTDGQRTRLEFGASLVGTYRVNLNENITYSTNLELFSNYLQSPQFIDVKWFNLISMKLWKFITFTLSADMRYDHDVPVPVDLDGDGIKETTADRVRFAQNFGIGVGYKFGN